MDTNVIAYFVLPSALAPVAENVREIDPVWVAPRLWRSEMRNLLLGYLRNGSMDLDELQFRMQTAELLLTGHEQEVASGPVLELAAHSQRSAYDCEFVALANELGTKLVTSDKRLLSSFPSTAISMVDFATQ